MPPKAITRSPSSPGPSISRAVSPISQLAANTSRLSLNKVVQSSTPVPAIPEESLDDTAVEPAPSTSEEDSESDDSSGDESEMAERSIFESNGAFKAGQPKPFSGGAEKFKEFVVSLGLIFRLQSQRFPDEETKIFFASTFLEGKAALWWRPFLEDKLQHAEHEIQPQTRELFESFVAFTEGLRAYSGVREEEKEAERKLYELKQTGTVMHYAAQFRSISTLLGWNDQALAYHFHKGLKPEIRARYINFARPTSLNDLIDDAAEHDARLAEYRSLGTKTEERGRPQNRANQTRRRQPYYGPMPMELDNAEREKKKRVGKKYPKGGQKQKYEKLSQEERERRHKEKLCMYCAKPGHLVRDCRLKQQMNNAEPQLPKPKGVKTKETTQQLMMAKGEEPIMTIDEGKLQVASITSTHLHVRTWYWRYHDCEDGHCQIDAQHQHLTYTPSDHKRSRQRLVTIRICGDAECEHKHDHELHFHLSSEEDFRVVQVDPQPIKVRLEEQEFEYQDSAAQQLMMTDEDPDREVIDHISRRVEENDRRIQEVVRECNRRGARIPKYQETIAIAVAAAWFPCPSTTTCMMRSVPHIHVMHVDSDVPHLGISQRDAIQYKRENNNDACRDDDCKHTWIHFHHPKNFNVEETQGSSSTSQ